MAEKTPHLPFQGHERNAAAARRRDRAPNGTQVEQGYIRTPSAARAAIKVLLCVSSAARDDTTSTVFPK